MLFVKIMWGVLCFVSLFILLEDNDNVLFVEFMIF